MNFLETSLMYVEMPHSSISTHTFSAVSFSSRISKLPGYYDKKMVNNVNNTFALQD